MANFRTMKNVVFTKTDREYLTADIYIPKNKENIPIMILIHGGGWKFGTSEAYTEWCIELAERGICAMSINYRLSTPQYHSYTGALKDVEDAMSYLVSKSNEWNLDPYNLGFMGDSSGAHLSFMITLKHQYASTNVKCIVGAYGVYDLPSWLEYAETKWPNQPNVVRNLIGESYQNQRFKYEQASPTYILDKSLADNPLIAPDVFLTWGEDDGFVPASQSIEFAEKLKKYEGRIKLEAVGLKDVGHLWFPRDITCGYINPLDKYPLSEVSAKILSFIDESFKKPRFVPSTYKDKEDYMQSKTYRVTRNK
jgi:acetyl esterase/lipase